MNARIYTSVVALAISTGWALPADAAPSNMEAVLEEMAAMRADMGRMASRITTLEGELTAAQVAASQASAAASAASEAASNAVAVATEVKENPPMKVSWKGGPKIEGEGGWSFKPRGRLQYDAGTVSTPNSTGRPDGWGNEVRRARLGVEGDVPGGFGYKFDINLPSAEESALTDAILSYKDDGLTVSVGQHKNFQGLEELSSSRFISMLERAAFTDAFGFERRVGVSAQYGGGDFLVQAGAFTDNISDLSNKSWSVDGRGVYMPKVGGTQLHLAGSGHYRKLKDASNTVRYRQRPFVHFTGQRFIDTGSFSADSELGIGVEAAAVAGPLHVAAEGYWQKVSRPVGLANPTFFGGYAEVGYFLTGGDNRGYKKGAFDRVKPANPVDEGGFGAVQANLRYDYLDLTDAGFVGGTQNGIGVSLIWTPTDYTRFMLNYGRMDYKNAVHPAAGGDTSYSVNAFGARAQLDF